MANGAKRSVWKWTPQKDTAALGLAQGKTWKQLETEDSVAHSSLAEWVKEPAFQTRIAEHEEAIVQDARAILRRNAARAALQVVTIMEHGYTQHAVRLTAAKEVLDRVGLTAPHKHEITGKDGEPLAPMIQINAIDYRAAIAALAPAPTGSILDCSPSGENEGAGDGQALGKVNDGRVN